MKNISHKIAKYALGLMILTSLPAFTVYSKEKSPPNTSVYSEVSKLYQREYLSNGQLKPETYAFAEGKCWDRENGKDESLNSLSFNEMGNILAHALAEKEYYPTPGPEKTDLLIMVSWGKTLPGDSGVSDFAFDGIGDVMTGISDVATEVGEMPNVTVGGDPVGDLNANLMTDYESRMEQMMLMQEMGEEIRMEAIRFNSQLLGYINELDDMKNISNANPLFSANFDQLVYELEDPRYFVILQAFDFRKMWKEKKKIMLWQTKFSIRAKGRNFNEELSSMAHSASQSFGDKNKKLLKKQTPGRVIIGELEYLGAEKED